MGYAVCMIHMLLRRRVVGVLLAGMLLAAVLVPVGAGAQSDGDGDGVVSGVVVCSDVVGSFWVGWEAPVLVPSDFRVSWAVEGLGFLSWRDDDEVGRGNVYPGGGESSLMVEGLEPGAVVQVRLRARYFDDGGVRLWSGPWSELVSGVVAVEPVESDGCGHDDGQSTGESTGEIVEVSSRESTENIENIENIEEKQPTTQDTPPTVTTPQRVPRSTPRSDTPPSEPAPIRTITEGQSTTFAPPVPADRQNIRGCVTSIPENSKTFFAPGGCYRRSNGDVEYRHYFDSGHSSTTVFGVCSGPYTLEVITRDSRVQTSGNQIRVTTTPSGQDTDDAGTVQVAYLLHGTRTVTHVQIDGGQITTFDTASCALTPDPVTVEVRRGTRPAMTAAVAVHAPSTEYLSTPSTVTWECTQVLVDAGVQCALNSVISTTTQPTFPTPRGCRIVVTVSENRPGHGSTNCLTSDGIAAHEDTINNGKPEDEWLDVDSLPPCPLSTAPADLEALDLDSSGRKRCVATN